jgi:hypothetical protein
MQRWNPSHALRSVVPCVAITLAAGSAVYAQSTQGTLLGTVRDASGAVIPGAMVTATDAATGVVHSATTTSGGEYSLLNLQPAIYMIVVTREGFSSQRVDHLQLDARQQLRADVTLQVGGAAVQTVEVNAGNTGAINTESPSISATLSAQAVLDLPANYRNVSTSPLNVIQALPGVQPDTGTFPPAPSASATPAFGFSIQGGLPSQAETTVDGISAQNVTTNAPLSDAFPSAASIAEIRVDGSMNNAEFGQPGEVTTITKSGTNNLHGSAFWYFQNSAFNAVPFGATSKPKVVANDFGGDAGGPVVIPHLYNGKDKTFFFGAYEGYKFPQSQPVQYLVPTAAMRAGDFSQEVTPAAQLMNPFAPGTFYANNALPTITPSAQAYLNLFPLPNHGNTQSAAAAEATTGYNYSANKPANYGSEQFDARIDHYFGQKALVFGRYTWKNINLQTPSVLSVPNSTEFDQYRILATSFSYNFTTRLINEFRFGFTLEQNGATNPLNGTAITNAAGLNGIGPSFPFNGVTELDFTALTSENADRLSETTKSRLFQYADNLTWSKGAHTIKFGGDIRHLEAVTPLDFVGADNYGTFNFTGAFTNQEFADFLLGLPQSSNLDDVTRDNDGIATYYAAFVQDDWKVSPQLTLTYGLRYEFHPAYADASGNTGNFDPSVPGTGQVIYPDGKQALLAPGELADFNACPVTGVDNPYATGGSANGVACTPVIDNSAAGLPGGLRHAPLLRFLPRFGVAFRPFGNDSTAIRAGAGMYEITTLGRVFYSLTGTLQSDVRTYTNAETAKGPDYQWPSTSAGGTGLSAPDYGTAYFGTANDVNWKDPYSVQWNLSVDHAFDHGFGVRASYIAMKTVHLVWAPNLNDMSLGTTIATDRPLSDRPFPDWGTINTRSTSASAIYNSGQVDVTRRFTNGFSLDSAYTFASNLADNQGPQESSFAAETGGARASYLYNRELDFGNVYGTRRNRWITTSLYDLPVGRGKMFGSRMNYLEDTVLGGWQLSNIFLWQSGPYLTPYIPSGDADPSGTGSGSLFGRDQHPDQIFSANLKPAGRGRNDWINRQAFACPSNTGYIATSFAGNACGVGVSSNPIGRFGTARDGIVTGPGTVNLSTGLNKTFPLTSRVSLRAEGTFTNVLNHTNLADPNTNEASGTFGIITEARGSDFAGSRTGQVSASLVF